MNSDMSACLYGIPAPYNVYSTCAGHNRLVSKIILNFSPFITLRHVFVLPK